MKRFLLPLAALLVCLAALNSCEKENYEENATFTPYGLGTKMTKTQAKIAEGFNAFGLDLFRELNVGNGYKNAFFSPFSMENALLLAAAGEKESTQNYKEMMQVLGQAGQDREEVLGTYKMLLKGFESLDRETTFSSANSAWVNSDFCPGGFSGKYESLVQDYLGAELFKRSFSSEDVTSQVNNWVEDKTAGKIPHLLNDVGNSSAVLVNALLLDGGWSGIYFKEESNVLEFKGISGKKKVPSLGAVTILKANENKDYQACRFPLGNGNYAVTMIVPKKNFEGFVKSFDNGRWNSINGSLSTYEVTAHVPVFTESSTHEDELIPALKKMGMTMAFGSGGYTEILDNGAPMAIGAIVQKAEMDFNKNGITAAAATVVLMFGTNFPPTKPEYKKMTFNVDKPFIYIISETGSNTILFTGIKSEM